MDLTRNVASGHLYDEMNFGKGATSQQTTSPRTSNNTVRSFQEICCGCLNHLSWKTPRDMKSMSVRQIVALFSKNGLSGMAEICNKEKLDGSFVCELTIDELMTEPFNQNEQQVDIFFKLLSQSWIAIKLINCFFKVTNSGQMIFQPQHGPFIRTLISPSTTRFSPPPSYLQPHHHHSFHYCRQQ